MMDNTDWKQFERQCTLVMAWSWLLGAAMRFCFIVKPTAHLDPSSYHGGCPVIQGTKWAANARFGIGNALFFRGDKKKLMIPELQCQFSTQRCSLWICIGSTTKVN